MRFSFGYELTESVRAAILETPADAWVAALDQDGSARENGEIVEITDRVDLSSWSEGSRLIVRRERPHPGAQLSFTDHDGYRFQAILTDQTDTDIAVLERRHRQRAQVEDRIRDDKDTGLSKFPFKQFALNQVWLEIVLLAHDLIVWTPSVAARRRARQSRTEAAALPAAACRRPPRVLRTPREAASPTRVALGQRAARRLHEAENAHRHHQLTPTVSRRHHRADLPAAAGPPLPGNEPTSRSAVPRNRPDTPPPPQRRPRPHHPPSAARLQSPPPAYCTIRARRDMRKRNAGAAGARSGLVDSCFARIGVVAVAATTLPVWASRGNDPRVLHLDRRTSLDGAGKSARSRVLTIVRRRPRFPSISEL